MIRASKAPFRFSSSCCSARRIYAQRRKISFCGAGLISAETVGGALQQHRTLVAGWLEQNKVCHTDQQDSFCLPPSKVLQRQKSTLAAAQVEHYETNRAAPEQCKPYAATQDEVSRLKHLRNVGIFAHVDAGKTTVTERMLALAGIVTRAGNVDDGNTVTDYLPAERERGITIQSAAITFPWAFHNASAGEVSANDKVSISLIDTPGHVDFSVEVNRSVAVLDGAVLVVDAAAGVQAQTQTVWRAMTRPSLLNNHDSDDIPVQEKFGQDHAHEPLPCLAVINKMDKVGSDFFKAVKSLRNKLPGANPIPIQLPVFVSNSGNSYEGVAQHDLLVNLVVADPNDSQVRSEDFCGIVDLVHMRVVLWPNSVAHDLVENVIPTVVPLWTETHELLYPDCPVTQAALAGRFELTEALAEVDAVIEELYLNEDQPTNSDLRRALRKATLSHQALPVMATAAVQGKGIEPCLDAIADFLPSPIDRVPPALTRLRDVKEFQQRAGFAQSCGSVPAVPQSNEVSLGHCFHPSLLALAFKVVHMKGRGGSGDGRVVFARVYSGKLKSRDTVQIVSPPQLGESPQRPRTEKVGAMLEMAGGEFSNLEHGLAKSGDVCALVGLKSVVTGDTIMIAPSKNCKKKALLEDPAFCAGVSAPKPVLTVNLEAESATEQARLTEALQLFSIEDPSLVVEETESHTMLSGLGELHIEITLERLRREHRLNVLVGPPAVSYRETVLVPLETDGMINFDRTIGENHLQAYIRLRLEPLLEESDASCHVLADPVITMSDKVRSFLELDDDELCLEELEMENELVKSLFQGCRGALKRGPHGYAMANMRCHILDVDADGGLPALEAMPGSLRAAAAQAIHMLAKDAMSDCCGLEPTMSLELSVPNDMVGAVLSDLTARRGSVGDVFLGDGARTDRKALLRGEVPLIEILGYANTLRSLTGGEASFTSEYKGHAQCNL